jgi:hypothetical protein
VPVNGIVCLQAAIGNMDKSYPTGYNLFMFFSQHPKAG